MSLVGDFTHYRRLMMNACINVTAVSFVSIDRIGPILHRFGDFAAVVFRTSALFHYNFGGVPVAPDRPYVWVGSA